MKQMETVRLTTGQALVRFLENQFINYVDMDGKTVEHKFVRGFFMLPGHGNVVGISNGMDEELKDMEVYQGKNEQGMALAAMAFAKQMKRKQIFACTSSVGPGACNMVTAAATATANNIPLLLIPGDIYASRQPDPVLQQVEHTHNLTISSHDAFQAVTKYWGRVNRPEQLMTDMISGMRVLTDTTNTGAVAISIPQDVQGEAYDYPVDFFKKRVWYVDRRPAAKRSVEEAVAVIKNAKKPLIICGGGVRYAEAHKTLASFASEFGIAFGETQAGKSAVVYTHEMNLGGIGTTGGIAANRIAHEADVVIGIGTRYTDFTTASKWLYRTDATFININPSDFQAYKMDAIPVVADANEGLEAIGAMLREAGYHTTKEYTDEVAALRTEWFAEIDRAMNLEYVDAASFVPTINDSNRAAVEKYIEATNSRVCHTTALGTIQKLVDSDAVMVAAAGSLPADMQKLWRAGTIDTYHMEYGYSCMGYEVAGALGAKIASPDQEVYALVGDGSFDMLHTELIAAVQDGYKINVMMFDNAMYGCINNLQVGNGNQSRATEKSMHVEGTAHKGQHKGAPIIVDYAAIGAAYGCKTYTVKSIAELEAAIIDAKTQTVSTLIDVKVLPKTMSGAYESWWRVGVAEVASNPAVLAARKGIDEHLKECRHY